MLRSFSRMGLSRALRDNPLQCINHSSVLVFIPSVRCRGFLTPSPLHTLRSVALSLRRSFASSATSDADRLSWDEFLRLRRQRRLSGLLASIPASMLGVYGGLLYFGSGEVDPTQTILGMDPFMMNGIFVLGCGLMGWLVGPTIGRGTWHLLHRRQTR